MAKWEQTMVERMVTVRTAAGEGTAVLGAAGPVGSVQQQQEQ